MKFSHNNATHLDISKYIRLQCACVKVIFVETNRYLFMSHSYSTYYVRTYGVLYIDLSITWQMRIPDAFFSHFRCSYKSTSRQKNKQQYNKFVKIPTQK